MNTLILISILKASQLYGVPAWLIQDITKIESNTCQYMYNRNKNGTEDLGCMQVNSKTAKALGLDLKRLKMDIPYSIYAGTAILATFKNKYQKNEHDYSWLCRFNVGEGKLIGNKLKNCSKYQAKLLKIRPGVYGDKLIAENE